MDGASKRKIVIAGGGPAGLMAAIAAAKAGADVTLCEQLSSAGRKLLATGGGHCNLTNTASSEEFATAFGKFGRFILPALDGMDSESLREFMHGLGVATKVEDDGFHVYPESGRAGDVLNALIAECRRVGVKIEAGVRVERLTTADGRVAGIETSRGPLPADAVVIACGGLSYPALGGTGGGYELARQAGHKVVDPVPALVGLKTVDDWPGKCTGITLPDVRLRILMPGLKNTEWRGALLFTHEGISGPAVLDMSGTVSELLSVSKTVHVAISLVPSVATEEWSAKFAQWQKNDGAKLVKNLFGGVLPQGLVEVLCRLADYAGEVRTCNLSRQQRDKLISLLSALPLTIVGTAGFDTAIVTRGGVSLKEVASSTLESRLVKGLYFAGEVLDLDGPCGGYNLQWAFSSGWLAGRSAVETAWNSTAAVGD